MVPRPLEQGTVSNYAIASSILHLPAETIESLWRSARLDLNADGRPDLLHPRFGLADAFNLDIADALVAGAIDPGESRILRSTGAWANHAGFAIDHGPMLALIDNYQHDNFAAQLFMSYPTIREALAAAFPAMRVPTIADLVNTPDPVVQGASLTLTANDVADADGTVVQVEFYRDADGNGQLDPLSDQLLGTDSDAADGWTWTGPTGGFPIGASTYFARAQDDEGAWSRPVSTTGMVEAPPPGLSVANVKVREGNTAKVVKFPVTLSRQHDRTVTVSYRTRSQTARAGSDFVAVSGKLKFFAGQTSKFVSVKILCGGPCGWTTQA